MLEVLAIASGCFVLIFLIISFANVCTPYPPSRTFQFVVFICLWFLSTILLVPCILSIPRKPISKIPISVERGIFTNIDAETLGGGKFCFTGTFTHEDGTVLQVGSAASDAGMRLEYDKDKPFWKKGFLHMKKLEGKPIIITHKRGEILSAYSQSWSE